MLKSYNYRLDRAAGFVLTIAIFTGLAFYWLVVFWPQKEQPFPVKIEVPKGASLVNVAKTLASEEVINNPGSFILATRLMGYEKSIQAGVFSLTDTRSNYYIIHQLVNGSPVLGRVMIPEGLRIEEIAELFHKQLGIDKGKFVLLCHNKRFVRSQLGKDLESLEGFLFPETYYFNEGESEENIITTMIKQYRNLFTNSLKSQAADFGFTELEILTLASIIEGEAIYNSERPEISAVYHNRLQLGMKLQADPTIQYIIEDGPRRLLRKDLKIDSPYNTYLYPGLPPSPINNPGKESILAALNPVESDFLFFVAKGDGYHTFTRTEKDHSKAKRDFQKIRQKYKRERGKKLQ